jgi:hypothetical protein
MKCFILHLPFDLPFIAISYSIHVFMQLAIRGAPSIQYVGASIGDLHLRMTAVSRKCQGSLNFPGTRQRIMHSQQACMQAQDINNKDPESPNLVLPLSLPSCQRNPCLAANVRGVVRLLCCHRSHAATRRTVSKQPTAGACLVGEVGNCEALQDSHTCLFTTMFRHCMMVRSICSFHSHDMLAFSMF